MEDKLDQMIKDLRTQKEEKTSDFVRIFEYFVSQDGIYGKTKITKAQRNMIYVYGIMHEKHPKWNLEKAAKSLALLLISEDGESRKGMVELFRGILSQMRNESVSMEIPGKTTENPKK